MAISPSGVQRVAPQANQPGQPGQDMAEWLVPLLLGAVTTAALTYAFTPAATPAMAALGIGASPTALGVAGASTGGGIAHQAAARGMANEPVEGRQVERLKELATQPLGNPQRQPAAQAPSGGGAQQAKGQPAPNPFSMAFRRGFGRVG